MASGLSASIAGGQAAYYGFDGNGNTTLLTNPAGAVVDTYSYRPYGELASASETISNTFRFGGKWGLMQASQLTFARARYYSPALGRFISEEPSQVISAEGYTYAANDPVNEVDATGLKGSWWHALAEIGEYAIPVGEGVEQIASRVATSWSNTAGNYASWANFHGRSALNFLPGKLSAQIFSRAGELAREGVEFGNRARVLGNFAEGTGQAAHGLEVLFTVERVLRRSKQAGRSDDFKQGCGV